MGLAQKRAVLRDALRHERVRELEENRGAPVREERDLAMEPPRHRLGLESRLGRAPAAGATDSWGGSEGAVEAASDVLDRGPFHWSRVSA